jgi:hypothetical protein
VTGGFGARGGGVGVLPGGFGLAGGDAWRGLGGGLDADGLETEMNSSAPGFPVSTTNSGVGGGCAADSVSVEPAVAGRGPGDDVTELFPGFEKGAATREGCALLPGDCAQR